MPIQHELNLVFPAARVTRPVLCEMFRRHDVIFSISTANVSQHRGQFHLKLFGDEATVKAAEAYLREQGVEVGVIRSEPYQGVLPVRPKRQPSDAAEPRVSRKLWLTFQEALRERPFTWEMACRFDVIFDVRQSSYGKTVSIMAILLEGPASHVDGAIAFLREQGVEVEPIEKSVIEG